MVIIVIGMAITINMKIIIIITIIRGRQRGR